MGTECYLINLDKKEAFCLGKHQEDLFPFSVKSGYCGSFPCFKDGKFKLADCYINSWQLARRMFQREIYKFPEDIDFDKIDEIKKYYNEIAYRIFTWAGDSILIWKAHEDDWNEEEADIIFNHCMESVYY